MNGIKKMWYIYTMEYQSAIKRNEIVSFVDMWMDLETIIQSEVSQKEKNKDVKRERETESERREKERVRRKDRGNENKK